MAGTQSSDLPDSSSDLDLTFFRVARVARALGILWMLILGGVVLARSDSIPPAIVGVIAAGSIWLIVSWILALRDPGFSVSLVVIAVDLLVVVAAFWASAQAGDDGEFYGGLPVVIVAIGAIRNRGVSWTVALTFLAVRSFFMSGNNVVQGLGQILVYVAGALIFSWVIESIRSADARYRGVQAELAKVETERARVEERADISRHLHDSVLQTLALLQRDARDPAEVTKLARRQERELREWIYGSEEKMPSGFAESVSSAAANVEDRFRVVIDLVVVGDRPMNERYRALIDAAKEAMVNAAVHGGKGAVSVFAESDLEGSRIFVRDRGRGFNLADIRKDRHGVRESIIGRLEEVGGHAELKSGFGRGSEWRLEVVDE